MNSSIHRPCVKRCLQLFVLSLATALPALASAQEDGGRPAREREALRRVQAALRQSQEHEASLAHEKSELAAQRDKSIDTVKRTESQLITSRSDASHSRSELARLSGELDALRSQSELDNRAAQSHAAELTQHIEQATRLTDERTRTIASLSALLESAVQSLSKAERANQDMHALGLQMIEQIRGKADASGRLQDPVLGFGQVQLENRAEQLRDRLDALKLANVKPAVKPAP